MERQEAGADTAPNPGVWPSLCSRNCFEQVIEALPLALVMIQPDGRIGIANARAERMFGFDPGSLSGKLFEGLSFDRRRRPLDLKSMARTGLAWPGRSEAAVLTGLRIDGAEFPLAMEFHAIHIDAAPVVLAILSDLTARNERDREKARKQHQLDRSNADLDEFVYAASHDLKAPLRAISHLVQWIGEDIEATASPATKENLALLRGRAARLQLLLEGLLNYSRISAGPPIAVEPANIPELVHDITALLQPPPGFVIACEGEMPVIHTHRVPILSVLENLIGNGIKHHDRTEGRITVSMRSEQGIAEFRVTDDGPGIPPQYHDKIFTIFQTLASRDDVEGSGIGLAIVKRRVQDHGGRIWIESAPPKRGSTFIFTWQESV
jgi:PAS domain S-box-containing protein